MQSIICKFILFEWNEKRSYFKYKIVYSLIYLGLVKLKRYYHTYDLQKTKDSKG